jgi:hypothetical protein
MKSILEYITNNSSYVIIPNKGISNILLNDTKENIRKNLNSNFKEFNKTNLSKNKTDAFDNKNIHVHYDLNGRSEAIEAFKNSNVILNGILVFEKSSKDILILLQKNDPNISIEKDMIISYKLGISIYSSSGFNTNNSIDSILVFRKGYYS